MLAVNKLELLVPRVDKTAPGGHHSDKVPGPCPDPVIVTLAVFAEHQVLKGLLDDVEILRMDNVKDLSPLQLMGEVTEQSDGVLVQEGPGTGRVVFCREHALPVDVGLDGALLVGGGVGAGQGDRGDEQVDSELAQLAPDPVRVRAVLLAKADAHLEESELLLPLLDSKSRLKPAVHSDPAEEVLTFALDVDIGSGVGVDVVVSCLSFSADSINPI